MTDTEILEEILRGLRVYISANSPAAPFQLKEWYQWAVEERGERRVPDRNKQAVEITATIHNHGGPGQWTERTATPLSEAYIGPEYIDERLRTNPQTEVVAGNVQPANGMSRALHDATWGKQRRCIANPTFQHFWRCNHHPEAISNWAHGKGWHCKQGCDQRELKWCDNGVHPCDTVPHGTVVTATVAKATVSHLTGVCEWVLAKQPKEGIHPQAFSWWDCVGRRRYGYPSRMICDACGRELRLVSDECKPAT